MVTHDKFCPQSMSFTFLNCACQFLAQVRADEREQAAQRVKHLLTSDPDWREGPPGWWDCTCMEDYCECAHHGIERALAAARGEDGAK